MIRRSSLVFFIASLVTVRIEILLILLGLLSLIFLFEKGSIKLVLKRTFFIFPPLLGVLVLNPSVFIIVFLRTMISLTAFAILTRNFDIARITEVLKKIRTPSYLVDILVLTLRYAHAFTDEVTMIKKNLYLRGSFKKTHLLQSDFLGPVVGNLFIRSVKKSERVHTAMKLRGS